MQVIQYLNLRNAQVESLISLEATQSINSTEVKQFSWLNKTDHRQANSKSGSYLKRIIFPLNRRQQVNLMQVKLKQSTDDDLCLPHLCDVHNLDYAVAIGAT